VGPAGTEQINRAVLDSSQTWHLVGPLPELAGLYNTGYPTLGAGDTALAFEGTPTTGARVVVYGATVQGDGSLTAIGPIDEVNSSWTRNQNDPEISRDGTTMIFASDPAGGVGGLDLYMSTRSCL
jgi:hypothetical protein